MIEYNKPTVCYNGNLDPQNYTEWTNNPYVHNTNVKMNDTLRVSDIKDNFGVVRFKVAILTKDDGIINIVQDETHPQMASGRWYVMVVSYAYDSEDPKILYFSEYGYKIYEDALRDYEANVKKYLSIVDLETKHWQDISIYADKIGYTIVKECCSTCKWSKRFRDGKLHCTKNEMFTEEKNVFERDFLPEDSRRVHNRNEFWYNDCRHSLVQINPVVDKNGICKGFERN